MSEQPILLFTTAGSRQEAERLAKTVLKNRRAACVNIIPRIESWYWWQGKIEQSKEFLLLIKTSRQRLPVLARLIKRHHSYQVPELIACPIQWGDKKYLNWLLQSLRQGKSRLD